MQRFLESILPRLRQGHLAFPKPIRQLPPHAQWPSMLLQQLAIQQIFTRGVLVGLIASGSDLANQKVIQGRGLVCFPEVSSWLDKCCARRLSSFPRVSPSRCLRDCRRYNMTRRAGVPTTARPFPILLDAVSCFASVHCKRLRRIDPANPNSLTSRLTRQSLPLLTTPSW